MSILFTRHTLSWFTREFINPTPQGGFVYRRVCDFRPHEDKRQQYAPGTPEVAALQELIVYATKLRIKSFHAEGIYDGVSYLGYLEDWQFSLFCPNLSADSDVKTLGARLDNLFEQLGGRWSEIGANLNKPLRLSHINITMPKGSEDAARSFYTGVLGLPEIPKPESIRHRGGVWFDAAGSDIHVSIEEQRTGPDAYRHFGLECADVDVLRGKLQSAGIPTEDGRPAPWRRFFVHDPFGNRIEIHEVGGLRS